MNNENVGNPRNSFEAKYFNTSHHTQFGGVPVTILGYNNGNYIFRCIGTGCKKIHIGDVASFVVNSAGSKVTLLKDFDDGDVHIPQGTTLNVLSRMRSAGHVRVQWGNHTPRISLEYILPDFSKVFVSATNESKRKIGIVKTPASRLIATAIA